LYKVLWVLKLCQGKTQQFCWLRGSLHFSSGLTEDGWTSTAVPPNHGEGCRIDAITTSAAMGGNAGPNSGSAPKLKVWNNDSESKQTDNRRTCKLCFNSLRTPLRRAKSYQLQQLRWQLLHLLRRSILHRSCGRIIGRGFSHSREFMLFQMTERLRVFSPTSRRRCISCFPTLLHKKRRRGKSTILQWIRSWRTWRYNLPCNVYPGSPFKSWLHAYVKKWPRAISLPLPTPWTKHYIRASFALWTMKRFSRRFSRWRRTTSTSTLLARLPSKGKTLPKLRRRRFTAQNSFRPWWLRRKRLTKSQWFSALPKKEVPVEQQRCYRVAIQAISELLVCSKMPSAIFAN